MKIPVKPIKKVWLSFLNPDPPTKTHHKQLLVQKNIAPLDIVYKSHITNYLQSVFIHPKGGDLAGFLVAINRTDLCPEAAPPVHLPNVTLETLHLKGVFQAAHCPTHFFAPWKGTLQFNPLEKYQKGRKMNSEMVLKGWKMNSETTGFAKKG